MFIYTNTRCLARATVFLCASIFTSTTLSACVQTSGEPGKNDPEESGETTSDKPGESQSMPSSASTTNTTTSNPAKDSNPGMTTTQAPSSATKSDTSSTKAKSSDSSGTSSDQSSNKKLPTMFVDIVEMRSVGDDSPCRYEGAGSTATMIVTQSIPKEQNPESKKDYFQLTADQFQLKSSNPVEESCEFRMKLRWPKGTRAVLNVQQDGYLDLGSDNGAKVKLQLSASFIEGQSIFGSNEFGFSGAEPTEGEYKWDWSPAELGLHSDCSGEGEMTIKTVLSIDPSPSSDETVTATLDQISGLFRVLESEHNCD